MLRFYNTKNKEYQNFQPLDGNEVKMYVCGPTVYSRPHLGNARSIIVYDLLFRLLKHVYGQRNVKYVRNITDIDDKINKRAKELNISIQELTAKTIKEFHEDTQFLNAQPPTIEPKATETLQEIIMLIEKLIANDMAYIAAGHVYFKVSKSKDYGKLAGRKIDELIDNVRIESDQNKLNSHDFVLWKPAKEEDDESAIFDSPWGKGRPGWHIECSAMSWKYLGENFDIHGGGVDLVFPHHVNEIAQSCGAFPESNYANFWMHNGFLKVNGEKMSKSLGNFITIEDLRHKNIKGEVIRYALLATHYRKPLDFNDDYLEEIKAKLSYYYKILLNHSDLLEDNHILNNDFVEALKDDLNIAKALAILHEQAKDIYKLNDKEKLAAAVNKLNNYLLFLGLECKDLQKWFYAEIDEEAINRKIVIRTQAKKDKNYQLADQVRAELLEEGIILEDSSSGTKWYKK